MSNFPTAFWKKQPAKAVGDLDATFAWETGLAWSYTTSDPNEGFTAPFPVRDTTFFPFPVDGGDGWGEQEYHGAYVTATTVFNMGSDPNSDQVFYGWYLTGGYDQGGQNENDTSAYHEANPWKVEELSAHIDFEADYLTARWIGVGELEGIEDTKYNVLIQSGNAVGSFTLDSTTTLTISVSGLGQDKTWPRPQTPYYESMTLYLYDGSTQELICSGRAPQDDRNVLEDEIGPLNNYDMQQVKLYAGSDLETIINYQGRHGGAVNVNKGAIRNNTNEFVDQDNRVSYVNSDGTGIFEKIGLEAGDYEIRINASTIDGELNSGAFYGFTFSFS